MSLILKTATNPGVAQFIDAATVTATKYMVGKDPDTDFTSIQAAIDAAQADGHEDINNPAIVLVRAGVYDEDVNLVRGIFVEGLPGLPEGVTINGTVTCAISDSGNLFANVTGIQGLTIRSTGANDALVFTGATPEQLLLMGACGCISAGGHAILMDNPTPPLISGCRINASQCRAESAPGNPNSVVKVDGACSFNYSTSTIVHPDASAGSVGLELTGGSDALVNAILMIGKVFCDAVNPTIVPPIISNCTIQTAIGGAAIPIVTCDSTILLDGVYAISDAVPVVDGAGSVTVGTPVCAIGGGAVLSPAGGVTPTELYQASTVPPGTWAGPGDPVTEQEAMDRIAVALNGLLGGGGIP